MWFSLKSEIFHFPFRFIFKLSSTNFLLVFIFFSCIAHHLQSFIKVKKMLISKKLSFSEYIRRFTCALVTGFQYQDIYPNVERDAIGSGTKSLDGTSHTIFDWWHGVARATIIQSLHIICNQSRRRYLCVAGSLWWFCWCNARLKCINHHLNRIICIHAIAWHPISYQGGMIYSEFIISVQKYY